MPLVYDTLHLPGTASEVAGLVTIAERYAPKGPMLEPACGSGRYLRGLAGLGVRTIGFDADEGMVAFAQSRSRSLTPTPAVFCARMESFMDSPDAPAPGSIAMAFNPINTIRHLETDEAMIEHLAAMGRALKPRGVYVVGASLTIRELEQPSEDVWEGTRGRLRVKQVVSYLPGVPSERFERVVSHLEITRPGGVEHVDCIYDLRTYTLDEWQALLARAGWKIVAIVDEEGLALEHLEMGYGLFVLGR